MQNITNYESFTQGELKESSDMMMGTQESGAMSPEAKLAVEKLCEAILKKEAEDYHNDENPDHTYEGYMKECGSYLNECMGQAGYATETKPYTG
jgi:hypothetical protein